LLAIVTFDLHEAKSADYNSLKTALSKIGLEPHVDKPGSSSLLRLPNNTYAGKFRGKKSEAPEITDRLRKAAAAQIKRLNLDGEVFVVVGVGWAWGKKAVKKRVLRKSHVS
jgi:hypothetical protein